MGLPVEVNNLMMGAVGGYQISRSLRFRSSASAYLNRTPSSTTNQKTWTYSFWIKRGVLGSTQAVFSANVSTSGNTQEFFYFRSDNTIQYTSILQGTAAYIDLYTTPVFRDPSAWYHIVVAIDTTQATSSNRAKIYVNGIQITAFSTATYPSQNYNTSINTASVPNYIGWRSGASEYTDAYYAEVNFIDGQALTPSSFGETDSITGVWNPKKYSGTYGTNGFYLNFSDNSGATATTIGKDSSGNGNNWTPNNISVTAGTTYDSMIDSPTPYADGGNGRGNYAVLNPLDSLSGTASNGNLLWTAGAAQSDIRGTIAIPSSGKFYMECTVGSTTNASSAASFGLATSTVALNSSNAVSGLYQLYASSSGYLSLNGTNVSSSLGVWTAGDILQIAVDVDNTKMWLGKNNTWYDSSSGSTGNPSTGANATSTTSMVGLFPFSNCYSNNVTWNMGQRPFSYTPPSGYKALNTYNLPAPSIANGAQYMAATTYTGTGSALSVSNAVNGIGFKPDFVWMKKRSAASSHYLQDSVRGSGVVFYSDQTAAENAIANGITSFNSSGFSLGTNADVNGSGASQVAWNWKGGGTAVTNNSGTISSQVSANTSAGISIITYTGSGANATVGHGLGVAPSMVIVKGRSYVSNWNVWHTSLTSAAYDLQLNTTTNQFSSPTMWNSTAPTSSVFSIGTSPDINVNGSTYVAYCFSAVSGYSAFGKWTGNGSSDGPFVFTNFRPRYVMWKRIDVSGDGWWIVDSSRNTYNVATQLLFAQSSTSETAITTPIDFLSNGFKLRNGADGSINGSGGTYIYMAFAENPFSIARAR